jgi:hypothetical protein
VNSEFLGSDPELDQELFSSQVGYGSGAGSGSNTHEENEIQIRIRIQKKFWIQNTALTTLKFIFKSITFHAMIGTDTIPIS